MNSRLTLFITNPSALSPIVTLILEQVSKHMNPGSMDSIQLAKAHPAILQLIYYTESDKNILYIPSINSNTQASVTQSGWPMVLGILLGVIILLVLLLVVVWKRKARKDEVKFNVVYDREGSLSSFDHLHLQHVGDVSGRDTPSNLSSPIDDFQETSSLRELQEGILLYNNENYAHDESSDLDHFVDEHRMKENISDWNTDDDTQPSNEAMDQAGYWTHEKPKTVIIFRDPSTSILDSYIGDASFDETYFSTTTNNEGRVSDRLMICSICNKSMEGMPRKFCACGKETCNLSAHTLCVMEKYPLPSLAHPGTPPTMLPVVLCRYRPKS